ncbi:MAG: cytochrome P450 [Myxococcota bacterium]|nr:cytochrome P450 [Myxococcota bacterium]
MSPLPPGPRSSLLATMQIIRDPYATQRALRARYGDVVTFPSLNGVLVLGHTPAFAKAVFTADPDRFGAWATETLSAVLEPRSLLVSSGEQHKRDRKLLTPPFHGARMRAYGTQTRALARAGLDARFAPGAQVTTQDVTTAITLDVILATVFGVQPGPAEDEGRAILGQVVREFHPAILFTKKLHTTLFPPWRRFLVTRERFRAWLGARIAEAHERMRAGAGDESVLGLMLAARYDDGTEMSDSDIAVQLVTLLIAGHETTSIALAWAVHWLLRDPAALARLRAELDALGPDADPESIAKLPYLGAVCDETMRMNPIITEVLRALKKPLRVPGPDGAEIEVPAGIGVGVGIAAIHEDPAIYPEPHRFRPERFLERKYGPFEHLPFGGGHRRCIGAAFAMYEMKLVLATMVSEWNLELARPGAERPVRRNVTMGPEHGVPIRVLGRRAVALTPRAIDAA